jgi:GH24 family phage-related lysozyme (muramidase)
MDLQAAYALIGKPAFDLIVTEEDSSEAYYVRHYEHFDWPAGASGPTVGIGCDCGYMTTEEIRRNWTGIVDAATVAALERAAGLRGQAAHAFVEHYGNTVTITWDEAIAEFATRELPHWVATVEGDLPHFVELAPDCKGALVSLAYNRGASFHAPGPRFVEMRAIAASMAGERFERIPAEILAMQRLWPRGSDLWRRRAHEAALFAQGLKDGEPAAVH